jgi:hypothetical protein
MSYRADIAVRSAAGDLALLVEVKVYENIRRYALGGQAKYVLLACPDRFYLWRVPPPNGDGLLPTLEVDPSDLLRPYLEKAGLSPDSVNGAALELIIASWLTELIQSPELPDNLGQRHGWIVDSGLLGEVRGGRLEAGVEV